MSCTFLIGGSFNPFHLGHRSLVEYLINNENPCRVLLIPTGVAPHKENKIRINDSHRLEIIRKSLNDFQGWEIEDCELNRRGYSYTVDTLEWIISEYQLTKKPQLVMGDDWIEGFHSWKKVDSVLEMADLVLFHRLWKDEKPFEYPHRYLNNSIVKVSSTVIRQSLKSGGDTSSLLHPAAAEYIKKNGLYID